MSLRALPTALPRALMALRLAWCVGCAFCAMAGRAAVIDRTIAIRGQLRSEGDGEKLMPAFHVFLQ
jgi:hypothetical protein